MSLPGDANWRWMVRIVGDDSAAATGAYRLGRGPRRRHHGDYYGDVVNLAARLVKVAEPGEVLVSQSVAENPSDGIGFEAVHHLPPTQGLRPRCSGVQADVTVASSRAIRPSPRRDSPCSARGRDYFLRLRLAQRLTSTLDDLAEKVVLGVDEPIGHLQCGVDDLLPPEGPSPRGGRSGRLCR